MHIIREYIKFSRNLRFLIGLLSFFSVVTINAMKMSPAAMKYAKARKQKLEKRVQELASTTGQETDDKYFFYSPVTKSGIVVSSKVIKQSDLLSLIAAGRFDENDKKIPLKDYSIGQVIVVRDILKNWSDDKKKKEESIKKIEQFIQDFSFQQLIERANLLNVFGVSFDITEIFLKTIKIAIEDKGENIDDLERLHPDLQKSLMANQTIFYLRNIITQAKRMDFPDVSIKHTMDSVGLLAFSPDGNTIAAGGLSKIVLWDTTKTTFQVLADYTREEYYCSPLTFSPDGKKIVVSVFNQLVLWDISNLEDPKMKVLADKIDINTVIFSPQGDKIAAGGGEGLIVWNINTLEKQSRDDAEESIQTLAFSPDGTKLVSGGLYNLTLWDIKDFNKITSQVLCKSIDKDKDFYLFWEVAFSPDGKKIISADISYSILKLQLWNIGVKEIHEITPQMLLKQPGGVSSSLVFSGDGETIFLCPFYEIGRSMNWFTGKIWVDKQRMFIALNISDLKNITYQSLTIDHVFDPVFTRRSDVAISSDGNKLVLSNNDRLNLFIFLNDEQKLLINKIKNAESLESLSQMRLLYELCLWSLKKRKISIDRLCELEKRALELLPLSVQKLFFKDQAKDQPYSFCTLW